jgi:hypothetical protein
LFVGRRSVDDIHVGTKAFDQLADLLRWVLEVIVQRHDDPVLRCTDPAQQRVVLSVVPTHPYPADAPVMFGQSLDHVPGLVSTAILDQDDLEAVGEPLRASVKRRCTRQDGRRAIDRTTPRFHHPG